VIRCTALALVLSSWTVCAHAETASSSEARAAADGLTNSAIAAYERQDYARALTLLTRASVLAHSPRLGLYFARSHAALGQLLEAAADYAAVLETAETSGESVGQRRIIEAARDELSQLRPRIPVVEFSLGEAELRSHNLRLVVDGALAVPGTHLRVNPGPHEVVASDADGEKTRLAFEVGEGESKTLALSWRSEAARASKEPFPEAGSSSTRRTLGVVALGVGATGLGVGTVTGIAALNRAAAGSQNCPAGHCSEGPNVPENSSAFVALRTISAAGFVLGGAGIGTWLGLLLTTPTPNKSTEHPKVSPWTPVVGMGSAGARYVF